MKDRFFGARGPVLGGITIASALLALTLPSIASANVYTSGYTDDTASGGYDYSGYNVSYPDVDSLRIGLSGPTSYASFCGICSGASSGTTTPGTDATSSVDQASRAVLGAFTATGYGRADLAAGELGTSATGTQYGAGGYNYYVRGSGVAGLADVLNFSVQGADPTTTTDIGVTAELDGMIGGNASLQEQLGFGSANFMNVIRSTVAAGPAIVNSDVGGWVSYNFSPFTPDDIVFNGVYRLTGASQSVDISAFLFADSAGGISDYANTLALSLQLPSNVSFTSDSGVFLTKGVGSAPEPKTWAMMILGFGLVGGAMRRRYTALAC